MIELPQSVVFGVIAFLWGVITGMLVTRELNRMKKKKELKAKPT